MTRLLWGSCVWGVGGVMMVVGGPLYLVLSLTGGGGAARCERRVMASLDYGLWNLVAVEVVAPVGWRELEGLRLNGLCGWFGCFWV